MAEVALKFDKQARDFLNSDSNPTFPGDTKEHKPQGYAEGETASKSVLSKYEYHMPNEETMKAIIETKTGDNLVYFDNAEDFFKDLEI